MAAHMGVVGRLCQNCLKFRAFTQNGLPAAVYVPNRQKHFNPKFKKERKLKTFKLDLPDFEKLKRDANMSPEEQRAYFKKESIPPPRSHQERDIIIASTGAVFEAYVPPEGDGIASSLSGEGAKQRLTELQKKGKSFQEVRKIKQFDDDFDTKTFPDHAMDIYIEAHKLLENVKVNEDRLHELASEKGYPEMTWRLENKTYRWEFLESVEPPRVVHVRTTDMMSKENVYAQVTVRFHTKQILALYDRFGRLMYGSEKLAKDCLEYIVFEKHLADEYGRWRIHGKLIPDWMPPRQAVVRTMRKPEYAQTAAVEEEEEADSPDKKAEKKAEASN